MKGLALFMLKQPRLLSDSTVVLWGTEISFFRLAKVHKSELL